ncbi:MAG: carbon-nitrogen hydrolase family protein [Synergistaceae bacterium]|nr:carbon-nitrogen hydrolase family protein [Synergistaceae bacterium]
MGKIFKVAAAQMDCIPEDVSGNLTAAEGLLRLAAAGGAVLVVLPELFDTGYRVEKRDNELASTIPGPTTDRITAVCRAEKIFATGTLIERSEGKLYDTAFLTGPDGLIGTYRKTALWGGEVDRFEKGNSYPVFDIGICKVGIQICYEIGFPEGARILSLQGADVILYPSAFGAPRLYAWDLASRARALENGCYVIACNRSGSERGDTVFGAHSRIVNPLGDIIASAAEDYEVITAEVDLGEIEKQRTALPYLSDLRRDLAADYYRE